MLVTVIETNNTTTPYSYEPAAGRLVALESFYRNLSEKGQIRGFTIEDSSGVVVSHKSI
jgi:hypothetical protein